MLQLLRIIRIYEEIHEHIICDQSQEIVEFNKACLQHEYIYIYIYMKNPFIKIA